MISSEKLGSSDLNDLIESLTKVAVAAERAAAALERLSATPVVLCRVGELEHMTIGNVPPESDGVELNS